MTSFTFLFTLISISAHADLDVKGKGEFLATGKPGFIKIHAVGTGLTGKLQLTQNKVSGNLSFPLTTLDSGVELRDKHMKDEFIEVGQYPNATLKIQDLKLPGNPGTDGYHEKGAPFSGDFTVHGVTHPVAGTIDLTGDKGSFKGEAEFNFKMSDHKFREPKWLGLRVNDEVRVKAQIDATQ